MIFVFPLVISHIKFTVIAKQTNVSCSDGEAHFSTVKVLGDVLTNGPT